MLILSRRVGEVIYVTSPDGQDLGIALLGFHDGAARIGLQSPEGWNIQRGEQRFPNIARDAQLFQLKSLRRPKTS